jgi:hypothetical protein
METVAEFIDGSISSVMLVLFMLLLRRGECLGSLLRIPRASVRKTIILIEVLYDIPHTTKTNFGILVQISPRPLPFTSFPIHYSPVFL